VSAGRLGPGFGGAGHGTFALTAELFEDAQPARTVPPRAQQRRHLGGCRGAGAEYQDPAVLVQGGGEPAGRAADQGDDLGVLQRPAQPCAGVRDGGRVRQHTRRRGARAFRLLADRAADAVEHRVATGQYADAAPRVRGEQRGYGRPQRRGPRDPFARALDGQQVELPGRADQHLGVAQRAAGGVREAGPAVGADSDDGQGGGSRAVGHGGRGSDTGCGTQLRTPPCASELRKDR
jgi:hypothetical protein